MIAGRRGVWRPVVNVAFQRAIRPHVSPSARLRYTRRDVGGFASARCYGINVTALLRIAVPHEYRSPDAIRVLAIHNVAIDLVALLVRRFESVPTHDVVVPHIDPLGERECVILSVF